MSAVGTLFHADGRIDGERERERERERHDEPNSSFL